MRTYYLCVTASFANRNTGVFDEDSGFTLNRIWVYEEGGSAHLADTGNPPPLKNKDHPDADKVSFGVELKGWTGSPALSISVAAAPKTNPQHNSALKAQIASPFLINNKRTCLIQGQPTINKMFFDRNYTVLDPPFVLAKDVGTNLRSAYEIMVVAKVSEAGGNSFEFSYDPEMDVDNGVTPPPPIDETKKTSAKKAAQKKR
jgi:hypothetical protein